MKMQIATILKAVLAAVVGLALLGMAKHVKMSMNAITLRTIAMLWQSAQILLAVLNVIVKMAILEMV